MPTVHLNGVDKHTAGTHHATSAQWSGKPLTPSQVLVSDVRVESLRRTGGPRLEVLLQPSWSLVPDHAGGLPSSACRKAADAASNPIQRQQFQRLEEEYGWIRHLRLNGTESPQHASSRSTKCRWIHCSSKFEEYIRGFLWALLEDSPDKTDSMHSLESAIQQHTRFSRHGIYFEPFSTSLKSSADGGTNIYPMLMSVPFLDWNVQGRRPPLRFQIDKREGVQSTRTSAHVLRSVLQYFYRLEDTQDREGDQVLNKHKPWSTDRGLDLKVRQWYGHYPTALSVDELWMLVIDEEHIVTFSSNQTWKSQSPPHQLPSRVADISFRGIRNAHFASEDGGDFTAMTHAVVCLDAAVGLLHRNFWSDYLLPVADRYAGYLSHLRYRLHRSPSTRLVMELIACQEELSIVISITEQQIEMVNNLLTFLGRSKEDGRAGTQFSSLMPPALQLLDNVQRELTHLRDLRDNTDRLVTRTIQLVNIRLEDHGKAILVFTVVTIIFLPLNFVSSFFGMNLTDIRNTHQSQWLFWAVALCVTAGVVGGSVFLAFSGGNIWDKFENWRDRRRELHLSTSTVSKQDTRPVHQGFRVLDEMNP